ncbi:ATP-dependent zinc metalloprotease FtsH [Thermoproteota archaeon]
MNPNKKKSNAPKGWRSYIWYILLALMAVSIISSLFTSPKGPTQVDFSIFMQEMERGNLTQVTVQTKEQILIGHTKSNTQIKTYFPDDPDIIKEIREQGISIKVDPTDSSWFLSLFLQAFLPFILIGALWFFIFRQAQGSANQALSFGKSRASLWKKNSKERVTFNKIGGADEAVEELHEIVDFLKQPGKYLALGAKIPRGALIMGAPGTGKTLLAKAVAGEADVPFFSLSGSDFVEMFVGVGASRVRDLFKQAKKTQPSIIFVDEIDAVGRHRGAGLGGGHDEREQTLNQLLVEMDGFDEKSSVIVFAATNRPDILDPALLRPGRFDRQIVVDKPDIKGRLAILKIHSENKKFDENVDLDVIARRTPGFTGADLANLLNESALLSARRGKKVITMSELEESTDRVMAGPQRKSRIMSQHEKELIAYHEIGHAVVANSLSTTDPVHKISILPRGLALGYTLQLPLEDKHLISKQEIENEIKVLLGGRLSEKIFFNTITSGASNDIEKATELARKYVCNYGMSVKLGPRKYGKSSEYVFLGRDYSDHTKDYSEETSREIDQEIKLVLDNAFKDAESILNSKKAHIKKIAKILIKEEIIEGEALQKLLGPSKSK